jgi:hypothetical protein
VTAATKHKPQQIKTAGTVFNIMIIINTTSSIYFFLTLTTTWIISSQAFSSSSSFSTLQLSTGTARRIASPSTSTSTSTVLNESFLDNVQTKIKIGQESKKAGYGFKQMMADVIAGDDYNEDDILIKIDETISSAPCGT